jgi:predicted ATP-grasp superfamily ATP-dependent carboligase
MSARVHLIVGLSGRALAQMAERAAVPAVTIDAFADDDTAAASLDVQRAPMTPDFRFEPEALIASVKTLARHFGATAAVLGSGFESAPELIDAIDRVARVAGNRTATVRMLKDPHSLARLLARLGIPHPETRTDLPEDRSGWLVKRRGRAGGWHVRRAEEATGLAGDEYVQRRVDGELVSIVFLADGKQARVVGANRFWTGVRGTPLDVAAAPALSHSASESPYTFSGAVNVAPDSVAQLDDMRDAIAALVRASGLVGLNGIDCIVSRDGWWLLEVNPRPTSTVELHDRGWPGGLFGAHLQACAGSLGEGRATPPNTRAGLQVVYAGGARRVPQHLAWPEWVTDRPRASAVIAAGDPLCTVHALAHDEASVRRKLSDRAEQVCRLLAPLAA